MWCQDNNLSLNVSKTKELIVDYSKRRAEQAPINIDGAVVERVKSFKFLGVQITNELSWSKDSCEEVTTTHFPPQETEKICHGSPGTTEGCVYGPVHPWGQASCHSGPIYKVVSEEYYVICHMLCK